jgi:hypothetical protein
LAKAAAPLGGVCGSPNRVTLSRQHAINAEWSRNDDYSPAQHMTSRDFDGDRRFTVPLADGSTWKQIKEDRIDAQLPAPAQSYVASVAPAMFGSYLMRVSDEHSYRVSPIR